MADEVKDAAADSKPGSDEALLVEVRKDFTYAKSYWQENYEEAEKDMDCVLCIPPEDFRNDRAGRPCLWPDEISQYVNQTNNNLRQTKRAIKVSPRSEEAKDVDAEHRQAYIQGIEYASKAQSIYATAFESCVECGFGYWRVHLVVTGPNGEQEPRIRRIPNWATVLPDPDARESDFSDSNVYFVTDTMRQTTFAKRYPKAQKRSFEGSDSEKAPGWLDGDNITVAEWWKREEHVDKDGVKHYTVTQRITNGLEILETNEWIGSWIPIIGCFGLEKYKRAGGTSKRVFLSLVRRARGSQQMLAYIASQEAEEFGMAPRAPYLVVKGSVDSQQWKLANKQPTAYLEWFPPEDWNVQQFGPPPMPARQPFIPNAQAYEIAYERWRRSIQASMGVMPLPTSAQRQNEKSGIALTKIQSQESIGSFHFTDNFVRALTNTGIQINELITRLAELDSLPKQVLGRDQKGEDKTLRIAPQRQEGEEGQMPTEAADSQHLPEADLFFAHRGEFEVAISDGPSDMSQRDEVSEFVDTLLQTLPSMGLAPQLMQQIIAIAIRLKNVGTYGDEIADLLAPPNQQDIPPQARAMVMQAQSQLQMAMAEIQQLKLEKLGKVTEFQGKMALADKEQETKVLVAEISTKAQNLMERMKAFEDMMAQWHSQAHDLAMQSQQQQAAMAQQQQAQQAAAAQAQQQPAQAPLAQ
ncbi:hypothetical protein ACFPT7_02135 [Acidicapsa dinghuensis]|uniref:Phage P22-like portal protein n=1 Tax=Acidicapsa dinghuensis TaxID=2218256 RepID=A0ABW1ECZ7_9BACT|nr:hypothetical protein [Acidicapsa dinghuensis]